MDTLRVTLPQPRFTDVIKEHRTKKKSRLDSTPIAASVDLIGVHPCPLPWHCVFISFCISLVINSFTHLDIFIILHFSSSSDATSFFLFFFVIDYDWWSRHVRLQRERLSHVKMQHMCMCYTKLAGVASDIDPVVLQNCLHSQWCLYQFNLTRIGFENMAMYRQAN